MTSAVEIKNITKTFNEDTRALEDLCLNIQKGCITGIVGADSAGKTTLLRSITGFIVPDKGKITTLNLDPVEQRDELNSILGYMPQKFGLYEDLSVIENLELYAKLKELPPNEKENTFEKLLKFTNLEPFKKRRAGKLSGGMKQKLGLACALLGSPELLVLDEPSVGVDPISRKELMKMVKELSSKNTTTIWSTSYLDEAMSFDICVVMDKGKIIFCGEPKELGKDSKDFQKSVIELMGGYRETKSLLTQDFELKENSIKYPIEAINLEKKYGDFFAVKNNTFCIKKGEIFGLLGPNGAGKSTSFKMMCGLIKPTSGSAKIIGVDIVKNPTKARSHIGYMAQKFSLYGSLDTAQNLDFFASVYGLTGKKKEEEIKKMVEIFELEPYLKRDTKELSLGFKQRLALACAIMHKPPVLFLDEPTSGVDPIARMDFWSHIKNLSKKGVSVMVTTHFMDEAEYCDRISLFFKGETIATGTPFELKEKASADNMEEAFSRLIEKSQKNE